MTEHKKEKTLISHQIFITVYISVTPGSWLQVRGRSLGEASLAPARSRVIMQTEEEGVREPGHQVFLTEKTQRTTEGVGAGFSDLTQC